VVSELQSIVQFNEEMLDDDEEPGRVKSFLEDSRDEPNDVTDQLLDSDEIVCWTCGTDVNRSAIESTVDRLRNLRRELHEERSDVQEQLSDLQMECDRLDEQEKQHQELERQRTQLTSELDEREQQLASLREQRDEMRETVDQLEEAVDNLPDQDYSDVVSLHKEANRLEIKIQRLEDERDAIDDWIEEIESELEAVEDLKDRKTSIEDQLADLRTKVEQIEQEAVGQFNEHMEAVLSLLEYENLDRIWIERLQREVKHGRRKAIKSVFELHVIRQTDSGNVYEDTVDHLSESEREVTGLVFALAGYLAHDVYESVPFMLLDSLEAIDSERIATLVEYLTDYSEYLVIALLPEDAAALSDDCNRITEI
jgi:DNA repair exonuclease SbcCD ATPase subunit